MSPETGERGPAVTGGIGHTAFTAQAASSLGFLVFTLVPPPLPALWVQSLRAAYAVPAARVCILVLVLVVWGNEPCQANSLPLSFPGKWFAYLRIVVYCSKATGHAS